MRLRFALVVILAGVSPAAAQTPDSDWIYGANGEDIVLEVGGGILTRPEYESANDYTLRPWPVVKLDYLHLPFVTFGDKEQALKFSPSFRIISKRDDDGDLAGLGDVDAAFEVVDVRVGIGRHDADAVAQVGNDQPVGHTILEPRIEGAVRHHVRVHNALL